jgi:8-hydroxy-5-deazaflavin:NADPH oxidoreductase
MKIGSIGSGNIGKAIARHLAIAGHELRMSNQHGPESLVPVASSLGHGIVPATVAESVAFGDVVVLAIPYRAVDEVAAAARSWDGKIVVDVTNYYRQRDGAERDPGDRSSSAIVAGKLPGARVVKAFNTLWFKRLETESQPSGAEQLVVFYAGDDDEALRTVAGLIEDCGFAAVRTGSLEAGGRRQQPGSPIYNVPLHRDEAEARLKETG